MNSPFLFTRPLQMGEMLPHNMESDWAASNLANGQHCVIWEAPRTGKSTFVNQLLLQIQKSPKHFITCQASCYNIRSLEALTSALANTLLRSVAHTHEDWEKHIANLLSRNNPTLDINRRVDDSFSLHFEEDQPIDLEELMVFPSRLAEALNQPLLLILDSFHALLSCEASHKALHTLAQCWKKMPNVSFLLCGSGEVAWRQLFDAKAPFSKFGERIPLDPIDNKTFVEYIVKNFSKAGRIIAKEYADTIYARMEGHPYYIQQFAEICFSNTKGYMNDAMLEDAFEELLDMHQTSFERFCADLSTPQLQFLHAMVDQVEQFSSAEVLHKYQLNSSANISRIKDALEKKNVIKFVRKKPQFIDPMFKVWFKERFCKTYWF